MEGKNRHLRVRGLEAVVHFLVAPVTKELLAEQALMQDLSSASPARILAEG